MSRPSREDPLPRFIPYEIPLRQQPARWRGGRRGKGIGAALIVAVWVVADFLLAVTWLVVRLSRRVTQ